MENRAHKNQCLLAKAIIIMSGLLMTNTFVSNNALKEYMSDRISTTKPIPVTRTTTESPTVSEGDTLSHYIFNNPVVIKKHQIDNDMKILAPPFNKA